MEENVYPSYVSRVLICDRCYLRLFRLKYSKDIFTFAGNRARSSCATGVDTDNQYNQYVRRNCFKLKIVFADTTCLVWGSKCGVNGNCWLYDSKRMKYYLNFTGASEYNSFNNKHYNRQWKTSKS